MPSGPEDDNRDSKPIAESPIREADVAKIGCELSEISSQLDPQSKGELLSNVRQELDRWREGIDPQFEVDEIARTSHGVNQTIKELMRFQNYGCIEVLRYANMKDTFTSSDALHSIKRNSQMYNRLGRLEEMHLLMRRQESFSESAERHEREQPKRRHRRLFYKITPRGKVAIEMIDRMYPFLDRSNRESIFQIIRKLFQRQKD